MGWNGSGQREAKVGKTPVRPRKRTWSALATGGVVLTAAFIGLFAYLHFSKTSPAAADRRTDSKIKRKAGRYRQLPQDAVRAALPAGVAEKRGKRRKPRPKVDMFAQFQGEDRKLAEKIQEGLDADDLKATVQAAQAALRSDNPEVRANAVEALGWFGVSALPELTAYMADPDEDVRAVAASQWEQAVQHVEKANDRFNLVAAALGTLSDADQLTSLGGQLCSVALEVIDGEEDAVVAADRRLDVIQTLADIIEGGKGAVNAEAAKEAYNTITGNEWISIEEADRYLQDPDNYEAPELDR